MRLRDAIQDFMLECKVRRLVPRTIENDGKQLRYPEADFKINQLEGMRNFHVRRLLALLDDKG